MKASFALSFSCSTAAEPSAAWPAAALFASLLMTHARWPSHTSCVPLANRLRPAAPTTNVPAKAFAPSAIAIGGKMTDTTASPMTPYASTSSHLRSMIICRFENADALSPKCLNHDCEYLPVDVAAACQIR